MGYCPVHLPLFLGIPGLYPLHASGTLPPSPTVRPKLSADIREDKTGAQNCPLPRTTGLGLSGGPAQACPSPGVGKSGGHRQSYLTVPCWIPLVLSPAFPTRIKGLPCLLASAWLWPLGNEEGIGGTEEPGVGVSVPSLLLCRVSRAACLPCKRPQLPLQAPPGSCCLFTLNPTRPGVTTAPSPLSPQRGLTGTRGL